MYVVVPCQVALSGDNSWEDEGPACGRPADAKDKQGRCYWHSPRKKEPSEFLSRFLVLANEPLTGRKVRDFTRFVFPSFSLPYQFKFDCSVNFQSAVFTGPTNFDSAIFEGEADFLDATFRKSASFNTCVFEGKANFSRAHFKDHAHFAHANFKVQGWFGVVSFEDAAFFDDAHFSGRLGFPSAIFYDKAFFRRANFGRTMEFGGTRFEGGACLDEATFSDDHKTVLLRRQFGGPLSLRSCILNGNWFFQDSPPPDDDFGYDVPGESMPPWDIDLTGAQVPEWGAVTFQGLNAPDDSPLGRFGMQNVHLALATVHNIRFLNVRWDNSRVWRTRLERLIRPKNRPISRVADENDIPYLPGIRTQKETKEARPPLDPSHVQEIYKGLRMSYESSLHYSEAGVFHVREMEMRRLSLGHSLMHRAAKAESFPSRLAFYARAWVKRNISIHNVYRLTSNYGESYRIALFSVFAWFVFMSTFDLFVRDTLRLAFLSWEQNGPEIWAARSIHNLHRVLIQGIHLLPAQVAGNSVTDFLARLVGVFLIAGFAIALRRHFRR